MTSFFIIDVGNTNTKWGVANTRGIQELHRIPTSRFFQKNPKGPQFRARGVSGAIISTVVPKALPGIRRLLRKWNIKSPSIVSSRLDLGLKIKYTEPGKIGPDRLVDAVAAVELYGAPAVVIDFGTALTFNVISSKREYLGGVIAPGLNAMTDYLHEHTALLPKISLAEPRSSIGRDTVSAMRIGAVVGYRGLVQKILTQIRGELKSPKLQIIATGGHSSLIAKKIPEIQHINPELTLHGLRIIYKKMTSK
jgi:type III pantothenate kinase